MRGLLLQALVTPASVQDRDGGIALLSTLFGLFPFLEKLFADSAYQGPVFHKALASILRKRLFGAVQSTGLKFQGMSASISLLGQRLAIRSKVSLAQA